MSARDIVTAHIVRQAKRFPDLEFQPFPTGSLDPRDAALARAIDHAIARHWLTLAALIESRLDRPWQRVQPQLQAPLLVAAAQLFYLDRIPEHAAVNHAVEWVKKHVRKKAAGFVNAVLRSLTRLLAEQDEIGSDGKGKGTQQNGRRDGETERQRDEVFTRSPLHPYTPTPLHSYTPTPPGLRPFPSEPSPLLKKGQGAATRPCRPPFARDQLPLPDGRIVRLNEPVLAEAPLERLAQQTSHPPSLLRRWTESHGEAQAQSIALHNLVHPATIVTIPADESRDAPLVEPHEEPGFAVFTGDHDSLVHWLGGSMHRRVQDPASAIPIAMTASTQPRLVIDVCAGRGTKTKQIASQHPEADVIASDVDPQRISALQREFAAHPNVAVVPQEKLIDFAGKADLVVLDVPCSNTGVLARRVEARYRLTEERLADLVSLQRQIIADSIRLRHARGYLLYATCSIESEENDGQIEWIEKWHPLRCAESRRTLPQGLPGEPAATYHDGGFAALLTGV